MLLDAECSGKVNVMCRRSTALKDTTTEYTLAVRKLIPQSYNLLTFQAALTAPKHEQIVGAN